MIALRTLPSLKRIPTLLSVGEVPVAGRFTEALISEWAPLVASLARQYAMPGKLDAADIKQILIQHIWKLTTRVDPVTNKANFTPMVKTELRNKCVDLSRHVKAKKRSGRTGRAVICAVCGSMTRLTSGQSAECNFCKNTESLREVETYSKEMCVEAWTETGGGAHERQPVDILIEEESLDRIAKKLCDRDKAVYLCLTSPSDEYLAYLHESGHETDHRRASASLVAAWLGMSVAQVTYAKNRIRDAVKQVMLG